MGVGERELLAVDLDAPVPVVVPAIFGVGAEASSSGHALGVDAVLENTLVQDHGAHGLGAAAREAQKRSCPFLSQQPSTMRRPWLLWSVSKKQCHCCGKRYPWYDAFSARVIYSRSR